MNDLGGARKTNYIFFFCDEPEKTQSLRRLGEPPRPPNRPGDLQADGRLLPTETLLKRLTHPVACAAGAKVITVDSLISRAMTPAWCLLCFYLLLPRINRTQTVSAYFRR